MMLVISDTASASDNILSFSGNNVDNSSANNYIDLNYQEKIDITSEIGGIYRKGSILDYEIPDGYHLYFVINIKSDPFDTYGFIINDNEYRYSIKVNANNYLHYIYQKSGEIKINPITEYSLIKAFLIKEKPEYEGYISDLKVDMGHTTADLSWKINKNNDDDLILFYTDGEKKEELPVTHTTKHVTGLNPNTHYTFGLQLKTKDDKLSEMVAVSGKTLSDDISNLIYDQTHNSVILNWSKPLTITSSDKILIYQDGEKIKELAHNVSSNMINGLEPNTSYIYQVAIERADGTITDGDTVVVLTDEEPDDDVPPANITGLNATATENSITLNWTNPIDTDFSHVQIFRDGQLILPNLNDTTYTDAGLTSGTQYVYRIVSVDENGNSSSGVIQTVFTVAEEDNTPPATPQHITVSNGNKSGTVSWVHNLETDLAGYNLYVNGVKVNTGLILGNHYVLTNLDNGTDYNVELSAVDVSGNESDKSQALTITPDEQALPVVETKYDLKSVADGTASWFNGLWLILAFSVAIPLAFLIARRVKALIVGG